MFKIICDIKAMNIKKELAEMKNSPEASKIAPAVQKHGIILGYENCKACDVGNIKLTSTSKSPSIESVNNILGMWNRNALSPYNENYYDAYKDILDKISKNSFNPKNLKFVGLFTEDTGLTSPLLDKVLQVYEAIIDTTLPQTTYALSHKTSYDTGYKEYHHKFSFLEVTNSTKNTFFTFGTLDDHGNYKYASSGIVAYLLRNKGTLDCNKVTYDDAEYNGYFVYGGKIHNSYRSDNFKQYIKFLEKDFIEKIHVTLSIIRQCKVGDKVIAMVDSNAGEATSNADFIKITCNNLGGKLQSTHETIDVLCQKEGVDYKLAGNNIFSITCGNYNSLINFDDEGEILGAKITDTYDKQDIVHDEM